MLDLEPRVAECVLVSRPDERLGEETVAFVQLNESMAATAEELLVHCAQHLARYKVPDEIRIVAELPRTPLGKVLRVELVRVAAQAP